MGNQAKPRGLLSWRKILVGLLFAGVASGAFFLGRNGALSQATAKQPVVAAIPAQAPAPPPPAAPPPSPDYTRNVVAYIYGSIPITREELGEYLIKRMDPDRLEHLVHKRIIEYHCQRQGITVSPAEVEADLADNLKSLGNVTLKDFAEKILKPRGKTLYEWKEDVIRPKLLLTKLCRDRVRVEDDDLYKAFENAYGEKVKVKMIIWPVAEQKIAMKEWASIRKDDTAFDEAARKQADPTLASVGGVVNPFGRYQLESPELDRVVFSLKPGEVSEIIGTKEGLVVAKLIERLPPDTSVRLEDVRAKLSQDIFDRKVQKTIPEVFAELKKQSDPRLLLKNYESAEALERDVKRELESAAPRKPGAGQ